MINEIKITTRKSKLALWQTNFIKFKLKKFNKKINIKIKGIKTYGDIHTSQALYNIGGKGLFIKELEKEIIENKADIAIHSMKDVPYIISKNLKISTIIKRTEERDAFISKNYKNLNNLPIKSTVGTTSLRRKLQLLLKRPDLKIIPLRGNIDSRIEKLLKNNFDSIILSAIGIIRLNLYKYFKSYININDLTPSTGQGIIGIENIKNFKHNLSLLMCKKTYKCIYTERNINKLLYTGCHSPIGAIATIKKNYIFFNTIIISSCGKKLIRKSNNSIIKLYKNIGIITAQNLISKGYKIMNNKIKKKYFNNKNYSKLYRNK